MTKKFRVVVTVDASVSVVVDAATEEEAKEKAMNAVDTPCLCWSCSDKIELGDPLEAVEATEEDES